MMPLFLQNNLYFLTENRIDQCNLLLYTIENNIKKKMGITTKNNS